MALALIAARAGQLGLFCHRELRSPHPLLPLHLMGRSRMLVASLVALFAAVR